MPKIMKRVTSWVMFRMFWLVASMALWFRSWIFLQQQVYRLPARHHVPGIHLTLVFRVVEGTDGVNRLEKSLVMVATFRLKSPSRAACWP